MKRILCIFILLSFVFCFVPDIYSAARCQSVDINTFDSFIIEQAQNIFTSAIDTYQNSRQDNSDKAGHDICLTSNTLQNLSDISYIKKNTKDVKTTLQTYKNYFNMNGRQCYCFKNYGIGRYKIEQNSYLAIIADNNCLTSDLYKHS